MTGALSNHWPRGSLPTSPIFYFKLPYTGHVCHVSVVTEKKVRHLIKRYCNDLDIKLVFSSFKIGKLFSVKDPIPGGLRSRVVYKFACAGCNACYVGETTRHFSTRVREHLVTDKASHIFKHLQNSEHCRALCSVDCFHNYGRFAYGSFRPLSVRLRLESIRLRPICQLAYLLNSLLWPTMAMVDSPLDVRHRSQSIWFVLGLANIQTTIVGAKG